MILSKAPVDHNCIINSTKWPVCPLWHHWGLTYEKMWHEANGILPNFAKQIQFLFQFIDTDHRCPLQSMSVVFLPLWCMYVVCLCLCTTLYMLQIPPCMLPVLWQPEPHPSSRSGLPHPICLLRYPLLLCIPARGSREAPKYPPHSKSSPGSTRSLDRGCHWSVRSGGHSGWWEQRGWDLLQHDDHLWGVRQAVAPPNPQEAASSTLRLLSRPRGSSEKINFKNMICQP